MTAINQNLSTYTAQDFNPIPPGEYDFEISDTDVVDTKTQKRMIKVSCKVIGPTHAGRIVFDNFVLGQDVAMIRLKTLATVSGHPRPDFIQDTQELHGLRFRGNVDVKQEEGYAPQNRIKSFKKIPVPQGFVPGMAAPTTGPHFAPPAGVPAFPQVPPMAPPVYQPPAIPKMTPPPMQQSLGQMPAAEAAKPRAPWEK